MTHDFKPGDRVRLRDGVAVARNPKFAVREEYEVESITTSRGFTWLHFFGLHDGWSPENFEPIPAPQKAEEGYFTPALACVPDDQPAEQKYRYSKALRTLIPVTPKVELTDKQKQQAESIGRAVANMSRPHDVYMNCSKDWGA